MECIWKFTSHQFYFIYKRVAYSLWLSSLHKIWSNLQYIYINRLIAIAISRGPLLVCGRDREGRLLFRPIPWVITHTYIHKLFIIVQISHINIESYRKMIINTTIIAQNSVRYWFSVRGHHMIQPTSWTMKLSQLFSI